VGKACRNRRFSRDGVLLAPGHQQSAMNHVMQPVNPLGEPRSGQSLPIPGDVPGAGDLQQVRRQYPHHLIDASDAVGGTGEKRHHGTGGPRADPHVVVHQRLDWRLLREADAGAFQHADVVFHPVTQQRIDMPQHAGILVASVGKGRGH
jgi:hypothetical protein